MKASLVATSSKSGLVMALVGSSCLAAMATWLVWQARNKNKDKTTKKSPPKAPMGILETIRMVSDSQIHLHFLRLARQLDSWIFELNLPMATHPKTVVVADPTDVRTIMRDPSTEKPAVLYGQLVYISPTREPSLFAMPVNAEWHRRRKGTMPAFAPKHVRRMNEVAVKHAAQWLEHRLDPIFVQTNTSFDVLDEMLRVILKAFCETAFEYDIGDEEMDMFLYEWDLVAREFILKSVANPLRKYLGWCLPERQRAVLATQRLYQLFDKIMHHYRHNLTIPLAGTILERIMSNPTFQNDNQRASEIFAYMVAGHDTTAASLSWTLLELAKQPAEQTRLRQALNDQSKSSSSIEEWSKVEALQRVVQEGLRLHPVAAAGVSRALGRPLVTHRDKYFLPKNTFCFLPFYLMFRNEDIFVDAHVFRPARWEHPTEEMRNAFLPFALGKQNCAGQALANAELHCILARLIQEYEFSVDEEGTGEFHIILKPVGLQVKATKVVKQ